MAVTTDIGNAKDIHPRNKQDVGKRLAVVALHDLYGKATLVYNGPVYESMNADGNRIALRFRSTGKGMVAAGTMLKGFEVAGADQKFYAAAAAIEGNNVIVYSERVSSPVAVRYAWADDAGEANLFNADGFPAPPFRTDKWKGITEGVRYKK
jgi:sialate O-acetylesterase